MTEEKAGPDTRGVAQQDAKKALTIVRDVYAGTLKLREKGEDYLPKFPREINYEGRRKSAVLFNAFKRTVKGLTGMVFRKKLELLEDVPEEIRGREADDNAGTPAVEGHSKNIDLAGRDLEDFAADLFEDAQIDGHGDIFVDMQPVDPNEVMTLLDEARRNIRPYWIAVPKANVIRAQTRRVGGKTVLRRYAFEQTTTEPDGDFGEKRVRRVRDYQLERVTTDDGELRVRVKFTIFRERAEKGPDGQKWDTEREGHLTIDEIPVATAYTSREGFMRSTPPLLDLALENILHYQIRSDRMNTLHIAGVPIPIYIGLDESEEDDEELKVGSDHGVVVPMGGDAKYLEPQGTALDSTRDELQDIERRMALLGLSMLMSESRSAETATSKRIDKSESDSQLDRAAKSLETALGEALRLHAKWLVEEAKRDDKISGGTIRVNRDFMKDPMDPQTARLLSDLVGKRQLSIDTMWESLELGEILPPGFDAELEVERLGGLDELESFVPSGEPGTGGNEAA